MDISVSITQRYFLSWNWCQCDQDISDLASMQASGEAGCACADQNKAANVRKIFNKNERARISCDQRTKVIDLERKVTCARISREERDLRSQLGRLEEQRKFAATDETAGTT